jgi:hypothetical protein
MKIEHDELSNEGVDDLPETALHRTTQAVEIL